MKSKLCNEKISLRHALNENEHHNREVINLRENIDLLKTENHDMKKEIEGLKEKAFSLEKQNLHLSNHVENGEGRVEELQKELERTKALFYTQKQISRNNEKSQKRSNERSYESHNQSYERDNKDNKENILIRFNNEQMLNSTLSARNPTPLATSQLLGNAFNKRNTSTFKSIADFSQAEDEKPAMSQSTHTTSVKQLPTQNNFNLTNHKPTADKLEFLNRQLIELQVC
jgi:chromosome segregation ATPase